MDRSWLCTFMGVTFLLGTATSPMLLAAGGWYLFIPPRSSYDGHADYLRGYTILDSKPLSQWTQDSAYDSAAECEAVKSSNYLAEHNFHAKAAADYIAAQSTNKQPVVLEALRSGSEISNANVNAWAASRCVKSDDPRLMK
ncbi:MAG: hypothetical protein JWR16_180 [Nevskia sp.]|nr:hypothetical protein [Nevskia sp.]